MNTPNPEELKRRVRELLARLRQQLRLWLPPQRGIKKTLEEIADAAPALCDLLDASERREAELRKVLEAAEKKLRAALRPKRERKFEKLPDYAGAPIPIVPADHWHWMLDGDGSLYWATKTHYAPREPVFADRPPKWATHVIYFGK